MATVWVGQERLTELTGYTKNKITQAITSLNQNLYIQLVSHRKKRGEFGTNEYILCNPKNGEPFAATKDVIRGNGLPYFTFPACLATEHTAIWSLAKMTGSHLKLYIALLWLANRARSNEFNCTAVELRRVSRLARPTFAKSLETLQERGLVCITGEKPYSVHLCDPYTGEPIHEETGIDEDSPANYYVTTEDGRSRRFNANTGNAEQIEQLIRASLPDGEEPIVQRNGDLKILCPFHPDRNPSCSVSPRKQGCFHCFGCETSGCLSTLIMQLRQAPKSEAIQQIAGARGAKIEYRQPDKNAVAIYSYQNENRKLLKQVLRYPNKSFLQRQPAREGGWIWDVSDLPPMLYNMDLLEIAHTVCITEGEKDAATVTEPHLQGRYGLIIGMTSGGAESWDNQLAKHLHGKRVILMPDADAAGAKFAESVKASLEAERIKYRVVTFDDVGAKDVSEFMENHTAEDLLNRISPDWVEMPDGQYLEEGRVSPELLVSADVPMEDITI